MKISTKNTGNFLKLFVTLFCLLLLNLKVFSTVVATTVFSVFNGSINDSRAGSIAPDKLTWSHASGVYTIRCEITAPYSYSTFQGSVNGVAQNANTNVTYFLQQWNEVQLGYIFQVFSPTAMPPACSQFTIKYKITNSLGQLIEDWREINLVRNDFLTNNSNDASLLSTPDLFLQDNSKDRGYEPIKDNTTNITQSQDIWNRNYADAGTSHLNPMYSIQTPTPNSNYLYFNIRNRSCISTDNAKLHLYWTIARFHEPWAHDWFNFNRGNHYADNKVTYAGGDYPMGNEITLNDQYSYGSSEESITINGLAAGSNYTYRHPWIVPNPTWYINGTYNPGVGQYPIQFSTANGNPVICLLARLDEPWRSNNGYFDNPSQTSKTDIVQYASNNNNVVTRNTYILNSSGGYKWQPINGNPRSRGGQIIVNPRPGTNPVPIHIGIIRDTTIYDTTVVPPVFTDHGQLNIYLDELLWDRWVDGGMEGRNIEVIADQVIKVTNSNFASLENIQLEEGEFGWLATETEYYVNNTPAANYDYAFALGSLDINADTMLGAPTNFVATVLSEPNIEEDNNGGDPYFTTGINNTFNNNSEISIYPNPASSQLYVYLKTDNPENFKIEIFTAQGKLLQTVDKYSRNGNNIIKLNVEELSNGIYLLKVNNDNIIHTQRFIINK